MDESTPDSPTPARVLLNMRIIWAALLAGEIVVFVKGLVSAGPEQLPPRPILDTVGLTLLVTVIPITFLIRTVILRRGGAGDAAFVRARIRAAIIFWAGCETVFMFGLQMSTTNAWTWPVIVCTCVPATLQAITFPRSSQPQ